MFRDKFPSADRSREVGAGSRNTLSTSPLNDRLRLVKPAAHVDVLSAEPWKHEDEIALAFFVVSGDRASRFQTGEGAACIFETFTDEALRNSSRTATDLKRISHIGGFSSGCWIRWARKSFGRSVKRGFILR